MDRIDGRYRAMRFVSVFLLALPGLASAAQSLQVPLAPKAIPQFVDALPRLSVQPGGTINTLDATGTSFTNPLQLTMCEFKVNILPTGTFTPGVKPATRVWGYIPGATCPTTPQDTYLGPVLVNMRGIPPPSSTRTRSRPSIRRTCSHTSTAPTRRSTGLIRRAASRTCAT